MTAWRPRRAVLVSAVVAMTTLPAPPLHAEDVEMQAVCSTPGKRIEYWAEAKRRHSRQGSLTVSLSADYEGRGWQVFAETTDPSPTKTGSGGGGPSDPKRGGERFPDLHDTFVWSVPDPATDGTFRRTQSTQKPAAKGYRMRVAFDAPDAHLEDTMSCDR